MVQCLVRVIVKVVSPSIAALGPCLRGAWLTRHRGRHLFLRPADTRVQVLAILLSAVFMYSCRYENRI
jgi:hypothetical protein